MKDRTHESSPEARKKPAEMAVFITRKGAECTECKSELAPGDLIRLEKERVLCMDCADLGYLEFLPRGDAALTRRATKYSGMKIVVLRWSKARKQYERQGVLVDGEALMRAEVDCCLDADARASRQKQQQKKREELDAVYVREFGEKVLQQYPHCPPAEAAQIAEHACRKYSGRVGRSASAKTFDPDAIRLAVNAHIRHVHTSYDRLLGDGWDRADARAEIRDDMDAVAEKWSGK